MGGGVRDGIPHGCMVFMADVYWVSSHRSKLEDLFRALNYIEILNWTRIKLFH